MLVSFYFPVHPCDTDNGGCSNKCKRIKESGVCECPEGFVLQEDGKKCEKGETPNPLRPCDTEDNAGCEHLCEEVGTNAVCKCKKNFILDKDGKNCSEGIGISHLG